MKKIILILFLTFIFAEYNNPNGKPFTLNVSVNYDGNYFTLDSNIPINKYMTINGGIYTESSHSHSYGYHYSDDVQQVNEDFFWYL